MIYVYTGQPGHGKTLHAIDRMLDWVDKGRACYVCNVTEFDHGKAGMIPLSPAEFRDWHNLLPDGAAVLVDEAYMHNMLAKRSPSSAIPDHVRELATHRHKGIDFIFVCQSPARQIDDFVHDLIEWHVHVRRRWGTPLVHLREFDYFERNPVKAHPTVLKRVRLPKRPRGLYKSTALDTTERRVPWYVLALAVGVPAVLGGAFYMMTDVKASIEGDKKPPAVIAGSGAGAGEDGAVAKADPEPEPASSEELRKTDYVAWLTPRIGGQPWTAPAYDALTVPHNPPRVFCMAYGHDGSDACACKTEQGTNYAMEPARCRMIAKNGQYEPFLDEVIGERNRLDDVTQLRNLAEHAETERLANTPSPTTIQFTAPDPGASVSP